MQLRYPLLIGLASPFEKVMITDLGLHFHSSTASAEVLVKDTGETVKPGEMIASIENIG
jgi:hypothetical protein